MAMGVLSQNIIKKLHLKGKRIMFKGLKFFENLNICSPTYFVVVASKLQLRCNLFFYPILFFLFVKM
jgi:hypothetical protein